MRAEVVVSVAVAALALGAAWFFRPEPAPEVLPSTTVASSTTEARLVVHVSGAVAAPGLVELPEGARVADAIVAAGGTTIDADLGRLNLASVVADGQQVVVPAMGEEMGGATSDGRIRINDATAGELEELPGVGPVLAERIVAHREDHGAFDVPEDLLDVPGIGEAKLQSLRDRIAVP